MNQLHVAMTLGFLLGIRHATDSDHLVAMSTLVSRAKRLGGSWLLGGLWGVGHTLTIFVVGALIIVLKISVPTQAANGMEFTVGVMLVVLGLMNLAGIRMGNWGMQEHSHEHSHETPRKQLRDDSSSPSGTSPRTAVPSDVLGAEIFPRAAHHYRIFPDAKAGTHKHPHAHNLQLEALIRAAGKFQLVRSFGVGMVHGLAGSTAIALLVLAAIPNPWSAMIYLLVFGFGSLVSMAALSAFMEWMMFWMANRVPIESWLVPGTGIMSLGFGLYIMYHFGWVG